MPPPPPSSPAPTISDAIATLTRATAALSKSEERAQAELARALSDARQAKNQRDEALNSLMVIQSEQAHQKKNLDTWKASLSQSDLTIQNQADTIAQLRQENINWRDQYARVEKSCQEWKEQFMRVEQERIRLLNEFEQLAAERDLANVGGELLDERYGERVASPPSSTSTKIGSASGEKPSARRRQAETVAERPQKALGPRKSTGKPSAAGTKTQTKTATNTSRPAAKAKGTLNQKSTQNPEASTSKGPTQKVIRRVHATIEVPIKVEDEEEELEHDLVDVRKGRVASNKDPELPTVIRKAARVAEPTRTNGKTLPSCMDGDKTPPPPPPRRRKSGIDREYLEPDEDAYGYQNQEEANVRHRPPPRRKSIRELKESDFEYHEDEEEEGEETDDELNLGHDSRSERPAKQQRTNKKSSLPTRKTGQKRKAADSVEIDEPVASARGARKTAKTR